MIQLQVLNKLLESQDSSIITLNNLTTEYFSDYKEEYLFIKNHIDQFSKVPDMETFVHKFPSFDIINVNEPVNYLLEELMRDKNKRFLAENFTKIRNMIMEDKVEDAMTLLRQASNESSSAVSLQCVDILKDTSRYDRYLEKIDNFDKYFINTGFRELDSVIGGWDANEELATIVARNGKGKCLAKGTKVLMADGTKKCVEDIKVGDKVQSLNRVNTVLALHNGKAKGYKIIPKSSGKPFIVSANHTMTLLHRKYVQSNCVISKKYELVDMSIEDVLKIRPQKRKVEYFLYRPKVEYEKKDLKIPPYILGLWLGDGTSYRTDLTNKDENVIKAWCDYGKSLGLNVTNSKKYIYGLVNKKGCKNILLELLREYNLIQNKHIPLDYLTSSREDRLELLAGLLDTDGWLPKDHHMFEICQKNKELADNIRQLCAGLGFKCRNKTIHNKKYDKYYENTGIYGPIWEIPTRIEYKKCSQRIYKGKQPMRNPLTSTFEIEEIPEIEYYGFMCDGDSRYLLEDNTLTHNTWILLKCAAAAAQQGKRVGIYSGEMSEDKVGYRIDTLMGHISNGSLVHGNANIKNEYKRYLDNLENNCKGSIMILTPKMINGPAGVSALRAFIEKYNIDILFIDQHSLLEDDRKAKNPVEKASNISKDLKLLQVVKRIPIISVCQQNREKIENGTFDTTQLAQSDRIAQDSTTIIFIERKDEIMNLHIVKSRDNATGKILSYRTQLNEGQFTFIPDSESTQEEIEESGYSEDEVF